MAFPYAKAVMAMLPLTPYNLRKPVRHESINDLPVHNATKMQMFYPTPESKQFNRTDAGKAFDRTLLPAEARIPHPQLVEIQSRVNDGINRVEVARLQRSKLNKENEIRMRRIQAQKAKLERDTTRHDTPRWQFRFREMNAEDAGRDGRQGGAVGWRYGLPLPDRKKGQIKIPTHVS